jgi:predicted phosphodiesterase
MRVAIIADIHGNQLALEAVLADLRQQPAVDQVVIAGDLCLNGPRPDEVLHIIKRLNCPVIQGNVDLEVVQGKPNAGPKKRDILHWTREQIGHKGIDYLASLPFSHLITNPYGSDLLIIHANPLNLEDAIFPTSPESMLEHLLGGLEPTIGALAFGHLHIAYTRRWQHLLLVDTGSCGLSRDDDQRAAYAILTCENNLWQAEHRRVPYDIKAVVKQLKTCGIPHAEKRIRILTAATYADNGFSEHVGKKQGRI